MEHAKSILNNAYTKYRTNRSRTILLDNNQYFQIINGNSPVTPALAKTTQKKVKPPPPPTDVSPVCGDVRCRAYKMDGNICNVKVKFAGQEFCVRHAKKSKPI